MSIESIPKQPLIDNLSTEWSAIDELLSLLTTEQWWLPSVLPGWTVQDIVAHIIGTESMLAGEQTPTVDFADDAHVHNEIGRLNERWVESYRAEPPALVHQRFREITGSRLDALHGMSQTDFDAPSRTPVGEATYARFMQTRLFDCWMHEQDIRDTVGIPGNESGRCAEAVVDEIVHSIGYLIGKRAAAPYGSSVTIRLTGPVQRTIHVTVTERAHVVDELSDQPTAWIELPAGLFTRLAGGRIVPDEHLNRIAFGNDTELAESIIRNLAYTI